MEPEPDVIVELNLQNGPDACRLRGPTGESDRLGWGEPLDEFFATVLRIAVVGGHRRTIGNRCSQPELPDIGTPADFVKGALRFQVKVEDVYGFTLRWGSS